MILLIPAYEPTSKMLHLIIEMQRKTNYTILLVDDGSGSKFQYLFDDALKLGCFVVQIPMNQGKGVALKTGFDFIAKHFPDESIICADCDGQHHADDIIKVANEIRRSGSEMVLGSRQFDGKVPFKSIFGNTITRILFSSITGVQVTDTQTGLRGYPHGLINWLLSVNGNRFEYELNLLLQAKESNISIKEVPILTIYDQNNKGTHFHPIRDSIQVYKPLLKFGGSSFISGILDFSSMLALTALTSNLFLSVVFARIVSSIMNYSLNHRAVFNGNRVKKLESAPKYFALVVVIMLLNYLVLSALTQIFYMPLVLAKLVTEGLLFTLSYVLQKNFIFLVPREVRN